MPEAVRKNRARSAPLVKLNAGEDRPALTPRKAQNTGTDTLRSEYYSSMTVTLGRRTSTEVLLLLLHDGVSTNRVDQLQLDRGSASGLIEQAENLLLSLYDGDRFGPGGDRAS